LVTLDNPQPIFAPSRFIFTSFDNYSHKDTLILGYMKIIL
jgi:hypothetical protein